LENKNKAIFRRALPAVLALLLFFSLSAPAFAVSNADIDAFGYEDELLSAMDVFERQIPYSEYFDKIADVKRPDVELEMEFLQASEDADVIIGNFEGRENVLIWQSQTGTLDFTVEIPETGAYNIEICYLPLVGGNTISDISVLIDGESPFETARRIWIPRRWTSAYPITEDANNNEIRSPQVEAPRWTVAPLKDVDGLFNDPLRFYLEAGERVISLNSERAAFAIDYIKIFNQKEYSEYTKPSPEELKLNFGAEKLRLQGEHYASTNASTIIPIEDRGNYLTEPSHPTKIRYNCVIAGENSGEAATWEVNVVQDGWYKIGIKARQDYLRGMYANRRLYINGEVPNKALAQIKFNYSSRWQTVVPEDDSGEPVYVYLTQGKHELSLETIPGEIGDSMRRLQEIVYETNMLYMQILMVTGPTPDRFTDYRLHNEIPELAPTLERLARELREEQIYIEELSNQTGSEAAVLDRLADILQKCADNGNRIPNMVRNQSIKNNVAAVASWLRRYRFQPLEIDFIELTSADAPFTAVKPKFFKSFSFGWRSFIGSFTEDYTTLTDVDRHSINVWVSNSRFHANIIKRLTEHDFMVDNDVNVSINLVQGSLMESVMAGKGPDAAIYVGAETPVNLAIRDLLIPLSNLDGFEEVSERFQRNALTHYTYNDRVYGLPVTQTFSMMFYRKDMLASVGIQEPPETWDELIDMLPSLQRSHMQPGLVLPGVPLPTIGAGITSISISPATDIGHTFALLMLQSGMGYYNDDLSATTFDSRIATDAFVKWTDFYNLYRFDQSFDAFTRFRTGECPIIINQYSHFYNQLTVAAPEIAGLWDFTLVPGTQREDGTISHATNSMGSGYIILRDCPNINAAWEFGKWFTSTENMVTLGREIEGVLGPMGRFECANVEALKQLNWSASDLDKILTQFDQLEEIPVIPSSYVVTRSVINAFRRVVNDKWNPRETLRWYNIDINNEITRKRRTLGLDDN